MLKEKITREQLAYTTFIFTQVWRLQVHKLSWFLLIIPSLVYKGSCFSNECRSLVCVWTQIRLGMHLHMARLNSCSSKDPRSWAPFLAHSRQVTTARNFYLQCIVKILQTSIGTCTHSHTKKNKNLYERKCINKKVL